ncbi:sensor histidine kinase [Cupriavidus sp. WKF15]|uniref:sensor histidine kinase n=1 Tax=Cupriavidus sp. WKF15 TaxID=3032282 RepID=UPI0023E1A90F|nr:sensor histidine kinase [Cupriavidus sp. WKF15]WER49334.1 sensor histidine kinase [Cupriavidus sp. WKF15]
MTQHSPASEHPNPEGGPWPLVDQDVRTVTEVGALIDQTAHDLRSSLNAIQSWAYVLERAVDQAGPARRALEGVRAGVQQQLALVDEMEEAVRLLADEGSPQWRRTDLLAATMQAVADRRPAATARGVELKLEQADGDAAGWFIDADPARLAALLRHLLVHCIWRAQAGGSVSVHLSAQADHVKLRITESPLLDQTRSANRLSALSDFFGRRPPQAGQSSRQSSALLLTRRMVELHGAALSSEGETCNTDKVTVCIAVKFPRHAFRAPGL